MTMSWPYIAGFFDGEGNINYSKMFPNANMCQTKDRGFKVLTAIKAFLEAQGITSNLYSFDKKKYYGERAVEGKWADIHKLDISSRASFVGFMEAALPHLHVKKLEAQDCLRYSKMFPPVSQNQHWRNEKGRYMTPFRVAKAIARKSTLEVL